MEDSTPSSSSLRVESSEKVAWSRVVMSLKLRARSPSSSLPRTGTWEAKSPEAMRREARLSSRIGSESTCEKKREMTSAIRPAISAILTIWERRVPMSSSMSSSGRLNRTTWRGRFATPSGTAT